MRNGAGNDETREEEPQIAQIITDGGRGGGHKKAQKSTKREIRKPGRQAAHSQQG